MQYLTNTIMLQKLLFVNICQLSWKNTEIPLNVIPQGRIWGILHPLLGWLCTSPEIFSTSPKNFRTFPNGIINEINFKRQLYKLEKKDKMQTIIQKL